MTRQERTNRSGKEGGRDAGLIKPGKCKSNALPHPHQSQPMTDVVKIATLNINGITSRTRVGMLEEYIRRHELDIIFLQEITRTYIVNIMGYETFDNIGTQMRGTTIGARKEFHLTNITTLPTGRAIAAEYKGMQLINIYAPSGTEMQAEREHF